MLTLTENRRQHDPIERDALEQFRSGDVDQAIGMLRGNGRVVTGANAESVRDGMVEQGWQHRSAGHDVLMMARRNTDVDDLNRRSRRHVRAAGELSGEPLVVNERPFQIGDQVICTRNDYANGVRNGTTGSITNIDHQRTAVTLSTADGTRRLDDEYLVAGSMRHGYAITVHKAQGRTCDHGLLLASDDLHREMGYVGLRRGKQSNRMYLVADEQGPRARTPRHANRSG